ncbi:hypothetical protein Dip518_000816 [Parelusimicrobium proximum]|uniref:hypothetical protein n=1 Tax=Parelusimicrobium proximum TaxID=3228953 RepID=UPI003D16526A
MKIHSIASFNPQDNLPNNSSAKEKDFVNLFIKSYINPDWKKSIFVKEVPINSCGIADFVHIQSVYAKKKGFGARRVIAFEMKLADWKKALFQAYKYLTYADKAIIVIPRMAEQTIEENIINFKKLGVGLWLFDTESKKINKIFTPQDNKMLKKSKRDYLLNGVPQSLFKRTLK